MWLTSKCAGVPGCSALWMVTLLSVLELAGVASTALTKLTEPLPNFTSVVTEFFRSVVSGCVETVRSCHGVKTLSIGYFPKAAVGSRGFEQFPVVCENAAGVEEGRPRGHAERGQAYLQAAPFSLPVGLGRAASVSLCAPFCEGVVHA